MKPCSPTTVAGIVVYGAGAIGLTLASSMIQAGHAVTIVARGKTLELLRTQGFSLQLPDGGVNVHPPHSFDAVLELTTHRSYDYVFVTVKSQGVLDIAEKLAPSIAKQTRVVFAANGVPYWFSYRQPVIEEALPNTDNRDRLFSAVAPQQIIGSVVSFNAAVIQPGIVRLNAGKTLLIGEIADGDAPGLDSTTRLTQGPISIEVTTNIRRALWHKLTVNASINPASVIFQKPIDELLTSPISRELVTHVMQEVYQLGQRLGVCIEGDFNISRFLDSFAAQRRGAYTSMYHDFQAQRPLELERIIDTVVYLAELPRINIAIPALKSLREQLLAEVIKLRTLDGRPNALHINEPVSGLKR